MDVNGGSNIAEHANNYEIIHPELTSKSTDEEILQKLHREQPHLFHLENILEEVCMSNKDKYIQLLATVSINYEGIEVANVVNLLMFDNVRVILTKFGAEIYSVSGKLLNNGVVRVFFLCRKRQKMEGNHGIHLITNGNKTFLSLFKFSNTNEDEFQQIMHSTLFEEIESHFYFGYIGSIGNTILDEYVKNFIKEHCCKNILPTKEYLMENAKKAAIVASLACKDAKRARIELIKAFQNKYISNEQLNEGLIGVLEFHKFGYRAYDMIHEYRNGRIIADKMADRLIAFFCFHEDDDDVRSVSSQSVVLPDQIVRLPSLDGSSQRGYAPNTSLASGSSQSLDVPADPLARFNRLPSRPFNRSFMITSRPRTFDRSG